MDKTENENPDTWMGPLVEFATGIARRQMCTEQRAIELALDLKDLHSELRPAFKSWWETGIVPEEPSPHGYSITRIMNDGWTNAVPPAFTFLDALYKKPDSTLQMLREGMHRVMWKGQPYDPTRVEAEHELKKKRAGKKT